MAIASEPKGKKQASSTTKKLRSSPLHPPFLIMITEAIAALKERTGSSQYALAKFIEEKHRQLPSTFRKLLLYHLKKLVASGKLVKVKNSYKLPPTRAPAVKASAAEKSVAKPKTKTGVKLNTKAEGKTKAAAKPKAQAKPKAKAGAGKASEPAKVARTAKVASPGKKSNRAVAKKPSAVKNTPAAKMVKKAKSLKQSAKKAK